MKLRFLISLLVLPCAAASAADAVPQLPRPLLVPRAGLDPQWAADASWTAWRVGGEPAPLALMPSSSDDWSVGMVLDEGSGSEWIVLGSLDGRAASVLVRSGEMPGPASEIVPPRPVASVRPGFVDLAWSPSGAPGLAAWRAEVTANGRDWQDSGAAAAPDASGLSIPAALGTWAWRLRPELAGGVVPETSGDPSAALRVSGGDLDGDGVADGADRCVVFADPLQADQDGDGVSDACEIAWADVAPRGRPDGAVGIGDVVLLLRFAVGLEVPTAAELRAGDVAPAIVLPGFPEQATPRLDAPGLLAVDDAVLALRASIGLTRLDPPR